MELKDIVATLKRNNKGVIMSLLFGCVVGLFFNLIPSKYTASGSLFIKRGVDKETGYFKYDGYYSQQAAQEFTNSVVAILESSDMKAKVLKLMNIPENDKNIRRLNKEISVKKTGPQVILVKVRDAKYDASVEVWDKTVNSLIATVSEINKEGDDLLGISLISERPVVQSSYRSFYLFSLGGALISALLYLFYISLKEYFRD